MREALVAGAPLTNFRLSLSSELGLGFDRVHASTA
jgi:hypothetical protein